MFTKIESLSYFENHYYDHATLILKNIFSAKENDLTNLFDETRTILYEGKAIRDRSRCYMITDSFQNVFLGLRYSQMKYQYELYVNVGEYDEESSYFKYTFQPEAEIAKLIPLEIKQALEADFDDDGFESEFENDDNFDDEYENSIGNSQYLNSGNNDDDVIDEVFEP